MTSIINNIPKIPKRLPLIINNEEVLLPSCIKTIPLTNSKIRDFVISRFENDKHPTIIGIAPRSAIGTIGTAAVVHKIAETSLLLAGLCRVRIIKVINNEPYTTAEIVQIDKHENCVELTTDPEIVQLTKNIQNAFFTMLEIDSPSFLKDQFNKILPCFLPDFCTNFIKVSFEDQLKLLNMLEVSDRLRFISSMLKNSKDALLPKKPRVITSIPSTLLRNIRGTSPEVKELETKLKALTFPDNVKKIVDRELQTLSRITSFNPEYSVLFNYLSFLADIPWNKLANETLDLRKAKNDLEVDHFGLENVKKRILEYLAVRKLRSTTDLSHKGPILCLVGPPGVGKTSIARSIASTLNRPFVKVSLGGVHNVAEIRGHRRTYVGSMPGRIIQAIKQTGVKNPVLLLDEIDKMTFGANGNPSAALLEVLDPAQNSEFVDHYLNVPFDLSQILFIATANSIKTLSSALRDRLEIIQISGYTYLEKIQIALNHLLSKQVIENGLTFDQIQIPEESIQLIINNYTREAGVRELERKIGSLCRSVAVQIGLNENKDVKNNLPIILDIEMAKNILGPVIWEKNKWLSRLGRPGVAIGLVVTGTGGNTLAVESCFMPGTGKLVLTGSLGKVIKESSHLAWGWIRANAHLYGIDLDGKRLSKIDVHIHFPEGAVSKDGPSAGVTIASTLMSLFLDRPLLPNIAMTGELTLQGLVLPVGGIKDKVIAAHRDGFTKIIIPQQNVKNLHDIPSSIKDDLAFVLASDMHTIIETIFEDGVNLLVSESIKSKI